MVTLWYRAFGLGRVNLPFKEVGFAKSQDCLRSLDLSIHLAIGQTTVIWTNQQPMWNHWQLLVDVVSYATALNVMKAQRFVQKQQQQLLRDFLFSKTKKCLWKHEYKNIIWLTTVLTCIWKCIQAYIVVHLQICKLQKTGLLAPVDVCALWVPLQLKIGLILW